MLSRGVAIDMGLVTLVESVNENAFGGYGLTKCDSVRIALKPDAVPYNLTNPRRVSEPLLNPVKEEFENSYGKKWDYLCHFDAN